LVDNFKILYLLLEYLTVIVMPFSYFNIKEIVAKILDVLKVLLKDAFKLLEALFDFGTFSTTKDRHANLRALSSKLKLTLTNLLQVFASLNEGFILSKDCLISVKSPSLSRGILLNEALHLEADNFPFFAASNGFIKVTHAFLDIPVKHIVLVYLCAASLDDLVRDLG
jgi:hypothetical protein